MRPLASAAAVALAAPAPVTPARIVNGVPGRALPAWAAAEAITGTLQNPSPWQMPAAAVATMTTPSVRRNCAPDETEVAAVRRDGQVAGGRRRATARDAIVRAGVFEVLLLGEEHEGLPADVVEPLEDLRRRATHHLGGRADVVARQPGVGAAEVGAERGANALSAFLSGRDGEHQISRLT